MCAGGVGYVVGTPVVCGGGISTPVVCRGHRTWLVPLWCARGGWVYERGTPVVHRGHRYVVGTSVVCGGWATWFGTVVECGGSSVPLKCA